MTGERWAEVWAYYLALKNWLTRERSSAYEVPLKWCDPAKEIQTHILEMLGEENGLKKLYIERFCLCLELWLGNLIEKGKVLSKPHIAAIAALEEEIRGRDPGSGILEAFG